MKKVGHTSEFPCHSLMNFEKPEKSDFWKNEKNCWRYHHFTHVYVYRKTQSYEIQFLIYGVRHNFLSFWVIFYPITSLLPPNNPENQNFEKMKKKSGDVIILNLHINKHDHMMYAYSDMECDRHNCHFIICPTTDPEN